MDDQAAIGLDFYGQPVDVRVLKLDGQELWSGRIDDALLTRGQRISHAYDMHGLGVIDNYGTTYLDRTQCEALMDEIEFISTVSTDEPLLEALRVVYRAAEACIRVATRDASLVIIGN